MNKRYFRFSDRESKKEQTLMEKRVVCSGTCHVEVLVGQGHVMEDSFLKTGDGSHV